MHSEASAGPDPMASAARYQRWKPRQSVNDRTSEVLAMLASWTELDAARLAFTKAAAGPRSLAADWSAIRQWLDELGVSDTSSGEPVRVSRAWSSSVASSAERASASKVLLDYWVLCPAPEFVADAVQWAVTSESWEVLATIWMRHLLPGAAWQNDGVTELLAWLPADARAAAPLLSVAWAQSRAELSGRASRPSELRRT